MSDTLQEQDDQMTIGEINKRWCDECKGAIHAPWCSLYEERQCQHGLPVNDVCNECIEQAEFEASISEHQPAARGGGEGAHTPLPWVTDNSHTIDREGIQIWHKDLIIADVVEDQHGQAHANAALIIQAVNQHHSLVAEREQWVAAMRRFVNAYGGGKSLRLGNGQAQRSWDEFRQLLVVHDEQRSTSE